ncbi:ZSWM1 protein, partial [Sclerurus mexicanus]|nr:ZSWM1 protein [Sclerurus mexicanus]
MELEVVIQRLSQVFIMGSLWREASPSWLSTMKSVSKSPPDAVACSAPHPDHCAAQTASQNLPASDLPLVPLVSAAARVRLSCSIENPVIVLQGPPADPQLLASLQHRPEILQALLQRKPTTTQSLLYPSSPMVKLEATETSVDDSEEKINQRTEEDIRQSLSDISTEPADMLYLSRLAMVQKSMQLIGTKEDTVSVQILEDAHRVDLKGLSSCNCHFNQAFQLPCQDILAVLNLNRKLLRPEMLSRLWERGCAACQAGSDSADGLLEVLRSSWNKSLDKSQVVSFLMAEISQLLTHCHGEEFECRYRTLWELADRSIRPDIKVKL